MATTSLTFFEKRASTWLRLAALAALIGCGGGDDSAEQGWEVDAGPDLGGSDNPQQGTAGKKSETGSKAGSGGTSGKVSAADGGNGGTGGKAGAGGKASSAGKAGSGGKASSAGRAGSGGKAGSAGKAGSGEMSSNLATSKACLDCEKLNPDGICKMRRDVCPAFGQRTAMAGPSAGKLKVDLCNELYECIGTTGCANQAMGIPMSPDEVNFVPCLCGDTDFDTVCSTTTMPAGACGAEMLAAAETMMVPDVAQRLYDDSFAIGAVLFTAQCDQVRCARSCGYCDPSDPGCVDTDTDTDMGTSTPDMDGGV